MHNDTNHLGSEEIARQEVLVFFFQNQLTHCIIFINIECRYSLSIFNCWLTSMFLAM